MPSKSESLDGGVVKDAPRTSIVLDQAATWNIDQDGKIRIKIENLGGEFEGLKIVVKSKLFLKQNIVVKEIKLDGEPPTSISSATDQITAVFEQAKFAPAKVPLSRLHKATPQQTSDLILVLSKGSSPEPWLEAVTMLFASSIKGGEKPWSVGRVLNRWY